MVFVNMHAMSMPTRSDQNKRTQTRFPMNSPVKITLNECKTVIEGMCRNISGSGMLIYTRQNIPTDAMLTVQLAQGKIDFNSQARVVRITQKGEEYHLAVTMIQH